MNSREKILEAAIELFAEKGKHGARMEELALRAGVNKAMVYYYHTSKDLLYNEVLKITLTRIFEKIYETYEKTSLPDDPLMKVKRFLIAYFEAFSSQKNYTKIGIDAIMNEPEQFRIAFMTMMNNGKSNLPHEIFEVFVQGMDDGIFRDINYKHVMISIIGMNLVHYFGKSIAQAMLNWEISDDQAFLKEREESNIDLLLNGILKK